MLPEIIAFIISILISFLILCVFALAIYGAFRMFSDRRSDTRPCRKTSTQNREDMDE